MRRCDVMCKPRIQTYTKFATIARLYVNAFEQIQIYNINNGNRFTTYAIRGKDNSGIISVNGAAAHKVAVGDLLIIATYAGYNEKEVKNYAPILCYVDKKNSLTKICNNTYESNA